MRPRGDSGFDGNLSVGPLFLASRLGLWSQKRDATRPPPPDEDIDLFAFALPFRLRAYSWCPWPAPAPSSTLRLPSRLAPSSIASRCRLSFPYCFRRLFSSRWRLSLPPSFLLWSTWQRRPSCPRPLP